MTAPNQEYKLIPLTQGQFAKVSPLRYEELNQWKWFAWWNSETRSFYAGRTPRVNGVQIFIAMHRFILGLTTGDHRQADHRDHDTLNNVDGNLRITTTTQNKMNSRRYRNNPLIYKGVHVHKNSPNKVSASIRVEGHLKHLGTFPNTPEGIIRAAKAYDAAASRYFGQFAHLNLSPK